MKQYLSLESIVVVVPDQVSCDLAGEAAVLQMSSGVYYSLNEIGTEIWNLIQEPRSVEDVCRLLDAEFDVEHEQCRQETLTLLNRLLELKLVQLSPQDIAA